LISTEGASILRVEDETDYISRAMTYINIYTAGGVGMMGEQPTHCREFITLLSMGITCYNKLGMEHGQVTVSDGWSHVSVQRT
jgi:hypothetical protein